MRGDDLVETTPRQVLLQGLLGYPTPTYLHVPLVLGLDGERLSKRHGAVGLQELRALGFSPQQVLGYLANSLGATPQDSPVTAEGVLNEFSAQNIPAQPWVFDLSELRSG